MMQIKKIMSNRSSNNKGFTLIEVIAVLVILAILAVVAISRGTATEEANLRAEIDTLKGHLRYAQYLALNDTNITTIPAGSPQIIVKWGIQINGQSYTLVRNLDGKSTTFDSPYILPNESSATHSIAPFTATTDVNVYVLFDEWGSPYSSSTKLVADATITLTPGSQSITITSETGFIQ